MSEATVTVADGDAEQTTLAVAASIAVITAWPLTRHQRVYPCCGT